MSLSPESSSVKTSVWQEREWWFAIAGCAVILVINLVRPLNWDNALYQSIAWQWLKFGRIPYVGTFDQNFPGIFYFHGISWLLFGNSEIGFGAFDATLHLFQGLGIYLLVRRSHKPFTALVAALLSCEIYLSNSDWSGGQRDAFAMITVVFATILYFRIKDRPFPAGKQIFLAAAAGLLMGLVILLRPTFGLLSLWLGVVILLTLNNGRWLVATVYAFGVVAAIVAAFSPYFAMPGRMASIYTALIKFNVEVYGTMKYRHSLLDPGIWKHWLVFLVALAFALIVWLRNSATGKRKVGRTWSPEALLIAGYLVGSIISIMWMGKYFRYHFEPLYQLSAILLAVTTERYFRGNEKSYKLACVVLLLVSLLLFYPWKYAKFYYQAIAANAPDRLTFIQDKHSPDSVNGYRKQVELASYIRSNSKPTDRVEFACLDPWLMYRTGLESSSQFTSIVHIMISKPDGSFPPYEQKWRQEFVDSIRVIRPKYFVTAFGPPAPSNELLRDLPYHALEGIPGYKEMLRDNYSLDTTIGWWMVYRAKPVEAH